MSNGFLNKAYDAMDAQSTRALYDAWSKSYEEELAQNGYATPGRCAEALAKFANDLTAPVLDVGCGTGLSGLALKLAGFETIDGVDLSAEMLEKAKRKRLYRTLEVIEADATPLPEPGTYRAVAAVGVIGVGAAPIGLFHKIMEGLSRGGLLVFSLNDHALQDRAFEAGLCEWLDCGAARLLFREYGPHLPGIGLKANVYVVEKN